MATIKLTNCAIEIAKQIRRYNFFKSVGLVGSESYAFLRGMISALEYCKACSQEERHYLDELLRSSDVHGRATIEDWEGCIAAPGYFPYENFLEEVAKAEREGVSVGGPDGSPRGAFPCSSEGISFHKFDYYTRRFSMIPIEEPIFLNGRKIRLVSLDESSGIEWYAADVAIALTVMFARYSAGSPVVAFESSAGDLLSEHVLEGVRRAKEFDRDFPATYDENEYDYRYPREDEPFITDYYWLMIRENGQNKLIRKPLLDPLDSPY